MAARRSASGSAVAVWGRGAVEAVWRTRCSSPCASRPSLHGESAILTHKVSPRPMLIAVIRCHAVPAQDASPGGRLLAGVRLSSHLRRGRVLRGLQRRLDLAEIDLTRGRKL